MTDGGYSARNGARNAPVHRVAQEGTNLGVNETFPSKYFTFPFTIIFNQHFRKISLCYVKLVWDPIRMFG